MTNQVKFLEKTLKEIWKSKYMSILENYPTFSNTELFFNLWDSHYLMKILTY